MKTLIVGDLHINEHSIPEITEIFEKDIFQVSLDRKHILEIDRFIQLGDWFDKNTPSPAELKFSAELVLKLKKHYKEVIILSGTGEHDLLRGTSVIEHLESLGIQVVKGDFIQGNLFCGHFMVNESRLAFGTGRMGKKDLEKYDYVFLGHQHISETISPNIIHLGSVRYVSFNEVGNKKYMALLDEGEGAEDLKKIEIKSCIPMLETSSIEELGSFYPKSKVRFVINSFEDYKKNATILNKLGKGFFQFKIKMNFEESNILNTSSKKVDGLISKSNIIKDYISKIKDKEVQKLLEEQFKDNI